MTWTTPTVDREATPLLRRSGFGRLAVPAALLASAPAALLAQAGAASPPGPAVGYDLTAVLVFTIFGVIFVVATVAVLSRLFRPRARPEDEPAKDETYECGEPAVGSSWVRFDIRFYALALVFLIFDVEIAFLFPWAAVFKALRLNEAGLFVFLEMLVFVAILLVGFVYCWSKGDLDWVKSKGSQQPGARVGEVPDTTEAATRKGETPVTAA